MRFMWQLMKNMDGRLANANGIELHR